MAVENPVPAVNKIQMGVHVDQAKRPATRERRALELCEKIRTHTLYGDR